MGRLSSYYLIYNIRLYFAVSLHLHRILFLGPDPGNRGKRFIVKTPWLVGSSRARLFYNGTKWPNLEKERYMEQNYRRGYYGIEAQPQPGC